MINTDKYEYMVTHFKSGESDGAFATYEEAKAHYDSHDEEWREAHYIEEVEKGILMGCCLGCSHAYPLVDMNKYGLCEECELGLLPEGDGEE
tara:strand:- start:268 stop:543 length:276 start_codon:yes stop_codon:yes gene_type:complete